MDRKGMLKGLNSPLFRSGRTLSGLRSGLLTAKAC
jgi:hypothetical protein